VGLAKFLKKSGLGKLLAGVDLGGAILLSAVLGCLALAVIHLVRRRRRHSKARLRWKKHACEASRSR